MAYSPAPVSPATGGASQTMANSLHSRGRSASPPANAPLSKRDKRRSALQDRLHDLTATFSQNRDTQFRQQLHALQCDMTLINNADPYVPGPLPDSAEDIARLIEKTIGGGAFAKEMASLGGMWYSRFVQEVNQVKEARDAELAALVHRHNNNLERYQREYAFRVHFAGEEYNNLSSTLRERLVQTISGKKARLMREKEQLDIADTNALLLHPNQFSITNPASPGGIHGNRKTRHTRHRVDLDELGNGIVSEFNKRKRKAPEDDVGSPVRDANPAERAKAQVAEKQHAPSYSIHTLFTEKELSAHANQAHVATVHFFSTSKRADQPSGTATGGNNTDAEDGSGTGDGTGQEDNGTPTADMVRTASQNYHATRSTRTHGNHALNALAELSDKPAVRPNLPYNVLANYHARPNSNAPPLPPLMNEEVEDDCLRLERLHNKSAGWVDKSLIELLVERPPPEIDGVPQDPNRFSLLHPDFPVDMGMHLYPLKANGRDVELLSYERTKKTKS
ncbi:Sds3 domain-containing protein [Aspergillus clavatus NRRL 1]|uniref:Deacetylase complex subunit Sds3, putative n=1 Tax=Aspergillus clavatus (strain ATCC 1007 / CBS 513.65 / DSM 816 / NCTC 3887 / NRRL 1 / QM 1276 / 107) TaxID=344612 RepID=A1CL48_ASPCL|nr:deacetylase complex subunit Sds3, putative [Aspergillus clavatus NRRL 1]EAW09872.1 deacetylase complex subunit Sds3, putative [Aspergillus clavatus NRRL 1]